MVDNNEAGNVVQIRAALLSPEKALELIREVATLDASGIYLSMHAKDRMVERDISRTQIINVLKSDNSKLTKGPYKGDSGDWKCEIEGYSAGTYLRIVVAIEKKVEDRSVVVVTVILI